MALAKDRDGNVEVHTDQVGQRYGVCIGVRQDEAFGPNAPRYAHELWAQKVRCGNRVAVPPGRAPFSAAVCAQCEGGDPGGTPEDASLDYDWQGCEHKVWAYHAVASSWRGGIYQCPAKHYTTGGHPP